MKLLSAAACCVLANVGSANFLGNEDASAVLSRVRRNNDKYEWNRRSNLKRECQDEDCSFKEFYEYAENHDDKYGDDKQNLHRAFKALYTSKSECSAKDANKNARKDCLDNVLKSMQNNDRWVSCKCSNGVNKGGYLCTDKAPSSCKRCNEGYTLVEVSNYELVDESKCEFNRCTCSHGTGAVGANCPANGDSMCKSCQNGYFLENGECQLHQCTCSNGTPNTGVYCPVNGEESCSMCDDGHHHDGRACVENQCVCQNGNAASGADCSSHGAQKCVAASCDIDDGSGDDFDFGSDAVVACDQSSACDQGYALIDGYCRPSCSCENGIEVTGVRCRTLIRNGQFEGCRACNAGYELQGNRCELVQCTCDNGTPSSSCGSDKHGCDSCYSGYHLEGVRCQENQCTCRNGAPAFGESCLSHNQAICESCNSKFQLQEGACINKKEVCRQAPLDLVFVVDGSTSISPAQFDKMARFMIAISSKFEVGPNSARIGLVQYSDQMYKEIDYTTDESDLQIKLTHLMQRKGRTYTGKAISFAHTEFFRRSPRNAEKVMIVITDGRSNDDVSQPSRAVEADGITVIALGYNRAVESQLLTIVNNNADHKFMGSTVTGLVRLKSKIIKKVCETVLN